MKKERLYYLDFIRAIAVVSIVITHFNARYLYLDPPRPEKAVLTTTVSNVYIGSWGVSLFFIISGAALMYMYQENLEVKNFYKKRFLSIYPMFWIAYIAAFLYSFYVNQSILGGGLPKGRFIFSVLGFDGLLLSNGVHTFYILGEWFLGVIILIYLVFPLLRKHMIIRPVTVVLVTMVLYSVSLLICYFGPWDLASATIIFTRLPEVVFGMLFIRCKGEVGWKTAVFSFTILVINTILKPEIAEDIQTTYVGILSFLVLVFISRLFKHIIVKKICELISKYSYAVFLVHHVIIAKMMGTFDLANITIVHSYILFLTVSCVIAFFAWVLYHFHGHVIKEIKGMLQ